MATDIVLKCQSRDHGNVLVIDYAITNLGSRSIGLFNRVRTVRPDGTLCFDPTVAYVELVGEHLFVSKAALCAPPGLGAINPPHVTELGPGHTLSEYVVLATPVRVMHPIAAFSAALDNAGQVVADVPARAQGLVLQLGTFALGGDCSIVREQPAFPDVGTATPAGAALARQRIMSANVSLSRPLAVLNYRSVPYQ